MLLSYTPNREKGRFKHAYLKRDDPVGKVEDDTQNEQPPRQSEWNYVIKELLISLRGSGF